MATALNLITDWIATDEQRQKFYETRPDAVVQWINRAQLRFVDKAELLRKTWEVELEDSAQLPDDFLREFSDRVQYNQIFLKKVDYPTASLPVFSGTQYYAVWGDRFFVFQPTTGTFIVPYISKPCDVNVANIKAAELDIPSEFSYILLLYMDSMWLRKLNDIAGAYALLKQFDAESTEAGSTYRDRRDPVPIMKHGVL